ncbi:MAG: efflux transporter outer membrane subunit [Roseicyclus sp.]|nr:efflux transporter outer membrane subunit [Roseicyclus sp.]
MIVFGLAGCGSQGASVAIPAAGVETVSRFAGEAPVPRASSIRWWTDLGAPDLTVRIDRLIAQNPDLAANAFRVLQREIELANARSRRLPNATAGLSATGQSAVDQSGNRDTSRRLDGSASLSWEADLWGRIASEGYAARADLLASTSDRQALTNTLIAQMLRAYIAAAFDARQIRATQGIIASRQSTLDIVQRRFGLGVSETTAGNVASARESLAAARADLPALELALTEQQNRMDVLAGDLPRSAGRRAVGLPVVPPPYRGGAGVPLELLDERPDIRAAAARLLAANASIHFSIGDRLPSVVLTGRLQSSGETAADLFDIDSVIASLIADLTATLFDGGRGSRLVRIREAEARALAQDYVSTVLVAVEEVENALASERLLAIQAARQRDRLSAAREATQIARDRYAAGTGDFLTLLDASSAELSAETAYLQVQEQRWQTRVNLQLSLGGQWVAPPAPAQLAQADTQGQRQ